MITEYPIGLWARTEYFRVLKSIWNQEVKDFVISRMKASSNNIKPVIVLDESTKTTECYIPTKGLIGFELRTGLEADILCRKVEGIADWCINKVKIQKSNLTTEDKEIACICYSKRDFHHGKLTAGEKRDLKEIESKLS